MFKKEQSPSDSGNTKYTKVETRAIRLWTFPLHCHGFFWFLLSLTVSLMSFPGCTTNIIYKRVLLPTASEWWGEGNVFSLFTGGGRVGTYPPGQGIYPPLQVRMGGGGGQGYPKVPNPPSPQPGQDREVPQVPTPPPPSRWGWGRGEWGGGNPRYPTPLSRLGWVGRGYPKVPTPSPRDRTAYGALDTLRSVCLLRSRRRTFLYKSIFNHNRIPSVCLCMIFLKWSLSHGLLVPFVFIHSSVVPNWQNSFSCAPPWERNFSTRDCS